MARLSIIVAFACCISAAIGAECDFNKIKSYSSQGLKCCATKPQKPLDELFKIKDSKLCSSTKTKGGNFLKTFKMGDFFDSKMPKDAKNFTFSTDSQYEALLNAACHVECYFKNRTWIKADGSIDYPTVKSNVIDILNASANATYAKNFTDAASAIMDECQTTAALFVPASVCKLSKTCDTEPVAFLQCVQVGLSMYCLGGVKSADSTCPDKIQDIKNCYSKFYPPPTTPAPPPA